MKYTAIRVGAVGATLGMASIVAISGVASAMPTNTNAKGMGTDPYNSLQQSGTNMTGQNGNMPNKDSQWRMRHAWRFLNPSKIVNSGSQTLTSSMTGKITNYLNEVKTNWNSTGSDPTWMPSGTNWQASWSNWNPILWEANGSTYANWDSQLSMYLSTTYPNLATELSTIGL